MKMLKYYLMIAALGGLATPTGTQGASIGLQFYENTPRGQGTILRTPPPVDNRVNLKAGVAAVAQTNWNSITGPADSRSTPFTASGLIDNTGATTTAALSASGLFYGGGAGFSDTDPNRVGDNALADNQLLSVWGGDAVVDLSQIPYSQYDIYVYLACDNADRSGTLTIGSTSKGYLTTTVSASGDTSQWITSADPFARSDYLVFSGLTGDAQHIVLNVVGNGGINGFQVVSTAGPTQGQSIGVQFYENTPRGQGTILRTPPPTDNRVNLKAGVAAVAQTNWNSITGTSPLTAGGLIDNTGATTTAALSASGVLYGGGAGFSDADPNHVGDNALADNQLLSVWGNDAVVDLSQIPYSQYDIYVYLACDQADRSGTLTIGSTSKGYLTTSVSLSGDTSQWITSADPFVRSDYLVFSGLTGDAQHIVLNVVGNGGINGFQVVSTAGPTQGQSIGVQFYENSPRGQGTILRTPPPTDNRVNLKAGVAAVAQTNWNSITGTSPFTAGGLIDDTGATTTVALSASGVFYGGGPGFSDANPNHVGDNALADNQLLSVWGNDAVVDLSQIPYSQYDIYVYLACDNADRSGTLTIGSTSKGYLTTTVSASGDTSQWITSSDPFVRSDYLVFSGLTGDAQHIVLNVVGNGGINGLQIVQAGNVAPEPIPLNVSYAAGEITLTWSNPVFKLESASDAGGTYTEVTGASSPHTEAVGGTPKFYRLHWNGQ